MKKIISTLGLAGILLASSCSRNGNENYEPNIFSKDKVKIEKKLDKNQIEGIVLNEFGTLTKGKKYISNDGNIVPQTYGLRVETDEGIYIMDIIKGSRHEKTEQIPLTVLNEAIEQGTKVRFYKKYSSQRYGYGVFQGGENNTPYVGGISSDRIEIIGNPEKKSE